MHKKLILVCLINFFVAAMMGLALRFSFLGDIGINYRFLTHAHSHVAMLGWVYLMLYMLIIHYFVPNKKAVYNWLFWLTELAVVGMMVSFPIQGYEAISISFSTLHILCSYYFVYLIWKHHKTQLLATSRLLRASLLFMLLSTLGVWCLAPAVTMFGQASAFYQIAIQVFLHFQFNGWFLLAVIALFFHLFQMDDSKQFRLFFKFLISSTILTLALPIQWFAPHKLLVYANGFGVLLQLASLYFFLKLIKPKFPMVVKQQTKLVIYLYSFSILCLILKNGIQLCSLFPEFSQVVYMHRNFVIGFIHLLMLGVISGFLLAFVLQICSVKQTIDLYIGIFSFIIGFALTEILLLIQGIKFYNGSGMLTNYYLLLFIFSILLPLGLAFLLYHFIKYNHATQTSKTT